MLYLDWQIGMMHHHSTAIGYRYYESYLVSSTSTVLLGSIPSSLLLELQAQVPIGTLCSLLQCLVLSCIVTAPDNLYLHSGLILFLKLFTPHVLNDGILRTVKAQELHPWVLIHHDQPMVIGDLVLLGWCS
jgi:hypothetical protein